MILNRTSMMSGKETTRDLDITCEQLYAWWDGCLIQNAFPNLTASEREWLISGITDEEWSDLYGEGD